jgi:hypothetical protein
VYTQSKKLKLICKSGCEAEVVAVCDGIIVLMWVRALLDGQGIEQAQSAVCEDNTCSIQLLQREAAGSMRTKFLRARYGFTRQFIVDGSVKIKHVSSNKQAADFLTKARPYPWELGRDKEQGIERETCSRLLMILFEFVKGFLLNQLFWDT